MIRYVSYAEFKYLCYQFHFLVHAHPDDIIVFILGNECLSLRDIAINVATSTIRMPRFVGLLNAQEKYQVFIQQAEKAAGGYLNTKFSMLTACRTSSINTSEYESKNVEGIEVNHHEFLFYPTKAINVLASQCVYLPCRIVGIQNILNFPVLS